MSAAVDFRGASAEAVATLTDELRSAASTTATAGDLFSAAQLLRSDASLRRIVADASLPAQARQGLVGELFGGKVDATALAVLTSAAGKRWTSSGDLPNAVERLSEVAAITTASDHRGLVDELFGLGRLVDGDPALRDALSDPHRSEADRAGLLTSLVDGKVSDAARQLAAHAVAGTYGTVGEALAVYRQLAAQLNGEEVATVHTARPLSEEHSTRLAAALTRLYGRPVHLNTVVDPRVLGGVRVEIGDEVIDGTIATRLEDAGRRLAG